VWIVKNTSKNTDSIDNLKSMADVEKVTIEFLQTIMNDKNIQKFEEFLSLFQNNLSVINQNEDWLLYAVISLFNWIKDNENFRNIRKNCYTQFGQNLPNYIRLKIFSVKTQDLIELMFKRIKLPSKLLSEFNEQIGDYSEDRKLTLFVFLKILEDSKASDSLLLCTYKLLQNCLPALKAYIEQNLAIVCKKSALRILKMIKSFAKKCSHLSNSPFSSEIIIYPQNLNAIATQLDHKEQIFLTEYIQENFHENSRRRTSVYADNRREIYKSLGLKTDKAKIVTLRTNSQEGMGNTLELSLLYLHKTKCGELLSAQQVRNSIILGTNHCRRIDFTGY
jgi:hypothetical protein